MGYQRGCGYVPSRSRETPATASPPLPRARRAGSASLSCCRRATHRTRARRFRRPRRFFTTCTCAPPRETPCRASQRMPEYVVHAVMLLLAMLGGVRGFATTTNTSSLGVPTAFFGGVDDLGVFPIDIIA